MAQLAFPRHLCLRATTLGVLVALLASCVAAGAEAAELRPIDGAARILPQSFIAWTPAGSESRPASRRPDDAIEPQSDPAIAFWVMPLTDRVLSSAARARDLDPSLVEAMVRIVGLYDTLADIDPSDTGAAWSDPGRGIGPTVRRTTASYMDGIGPCEVYRRPRTRRVSVLSIAATEECYALRRAEPIDLRGLASSSMVSGPQTAPIFAAPLPGARMSSESFWAAQKAKIRSVEARLKNGWHERDAVVTVSDLQLSASP